MGLFGFGNKNVAEATIRVNSDTKSAESGLKSLAKTAKTLGAALGGMLVLNKVNQLLGESAELAKVQIQAEAGLAQALGRTSKSLLAHASALQKQTTYGDEAIIEAQTLIAAFIKEEDQIKKLTPAILDLAAAKGMDLRTAADLVTKSVASSTNALSRYGIQIEGAAGSTERIDNAVKELTGAFGGMAEALAKTDVGRIQQLENALGDLKEEIGKEVLPIMVKWNEVLLSIFQAIGNIVGFSEEGRLFKTANKLADINEKIAKNQEKLKEYQELDVKKKQGGLFSFLIGDMNPNIRETTNTIEQLRKEAAELEKQMFGTMGQAEPTTKTKTVVSPGLRPTEEKERKKEIEKQKKELEDLWDWYDNRRKEQLEKDIMAENDAQQAKVNAQIEALEKEIELLDEKEKAEKKAHDTQVEIEKEKEAMRLTAFNSIATINNSLMQMAGENEDARRAFARVQQGIAVGEAISNVYKAATGVFADTPGGIFTRGAAMTAAILAGLSEVAIIQAQHFQTGRIGEAKRGRQIDNINALIGQGETIVPAPQSAAHEETLRAIVNNTANTAAGVKRINGGGDVINFYGVSKETVLHVINAKQRKNSVGLRI